MPRTAKEHFLTNYDNEHATTMRVLRAFPEDRLDYKPHPKANTARALAWIFVLERGLGTMVWNDDFAQGRVSATGEAPQPPEKWEDLLAALEQAHQQFRELVASASDDELEVMVNFFTAPKTMGPISRLDWIWFLLFDQIHHRGQFSTYLRLVDAKVPSIYGPTADEPWV